MKRDLLAVHDFNQAELTSILDRAAEFSTKSNTPEQGDLPLRGKTLGMIFKKQSTRTRVSLQVGIHQLGGDAIFLEAANLQTDRGETLEDSAKIFSAYLDGIVIRTYEHAEVENLAKYSDIPVVNALTDLHHPCQIISDLYTIATRVKELKGTRLAYIGDGNNVLHSLIEGASIMGLHLSYAAPEGFQPDSTILAEGLKAAEKSGGSIKALVDPSKAVEGAQFVYTDIWTSMGQEKEQESRKRAFKDYQVNLELLKKAEKGVSVMHCLPAHRGEEITADVMDSPHSIVFEQAANRLHVQKAILEFLFSKV